MTFKVGDFAADIAVHPDPAQPGRFRADLSSSWDIMYVFGGLTMATALNAARSALQTPSFELLAATAQFIAPIKAGPQTLDVRTLRAGRGAEQLLVELRAEPAAEPDLFVSCTFGPRRESDLRFVGLAFPDVPRPDQVERPKPPADFVFARTAYSRSVEQRIVIGHAGWQTGWEPGPARWAAWHRLHITPRLADGSVDPLAYVFAGDMLGPAVREGLGGKVPLVMTISLEIGVHVFARTESEWLLQDAYAYQAGDGYVSGRVDLWDEQGQLVAQATQRAMIRAIPT